jgi:hypothetical protein
MIATSYEIPTINNDELFAVCRNTEEHGGNDTKLKYHSFMQKYYGELQRSSLEI